MLTALYTLASSYFSKINGRDISCLVQEKPYEVWYCEGWKQADAVYTKYLQEEILYENTSRSNKVPKAFEYMLPYFMEFCRNLIETIRAQTSVKYNIFLQGCITGQWSDGNMEIDVKKCYLFCTFQCGTKEQ